LPRVTSRDGTAIAYDRQGAGPPLILVGGGLDDGPESAPLAAYDVGPEAAQRNQAYREQLQALLAQGRRGDAVELFMRLAGSSDEDVAARGGWCWRARGTWPTRRRSRPCSDGSSAATSGTGR
jgi:hypothetical protein